MIRAEIVRPMLAAGVIAAALFTAVATQADTPSPLLQPRITTGRGCLENGDNATYAVGESLVIFLAINSSTFNQANATLFSLKDSVVTIIGLGLIPTNATFAFSARVGSPEGVHQLGLKASAGGVTSRRSCSFNVVAAPSTRSPQPTRTLTATATPTRTPTVDLTPSATPGGALQPYIATNRGCEETGDLPAFRVGDVITISFKVGSNTLSRARVTLDDIVANGFVNVFSFGVLSTNQTFQFRATVAPPSGRETLRLNASANNVSPASASCSFLVVPISATRTPRSTATPTP